MNTPRLVKEIRKKAEQRRNETLAYARLAFRPLAGCAKNRCIIFASSIQLPKNNCVEMIRTF